MLGSDFSGGRDLSPSLGVSTGRRALAEAIVRRLTTTLGALRDHPGYGFNLDQLIGTSLTDLTIKQRILDQVFAEEEIEDASVSIVRSTGLVDIVISLLDGDGPFELTISVTELGASAIIPANI